MSHKEKKLLHQLQIELAKLQKEVIASDLKLLVILEGRDAAGKDGTIKTMTMHLSPRDTRIVALGKPSDRQEKAWYFSRFVKQLPKSGEIVLFNRSYYNRLGVEKVMKFCTEKEYLSFFKEVQLFESMLVEAGFIIVKYYLDISKAEQKQRLKERWEDPLSQWKISPIDKVALKNWTKYSEARNEMLSKTNFKNAPWYVVNAEHKTEARLALMAHLLDTLSYKNKDKDTMAYDPGLVYAASKENLKEKLY